MTTASPTDAVLNKTDLAKWDISLDAQGDILTEDFFDTALLVTLFAEKRANNAEIPETHRQRGWIGNESFEEDFEIGSKIWLYEQQRIGEDTLNKVKSAARDALQWFVDRDLIINFTVGGFLMDSGITLEIEIQRTASVVEKRLFRLWENSGVTENIGD